MRSPTKDELVRWLPAPLSKSAVLAESGVAPACRLVEVRVGLPALPYLADHGFHDMVVVPGAFYVELARQIHRDLFQRDAVTLRDICFERPVILTEDELTITVRVELREDGRIAYQMFEATAEELRHSPGQLPCVRLEIEAEGSMPSFSDVLPAFDPKEFLGRCGAAEDAEEFYAQLRRNGNQYGPSFQTLAGVWPSTRQVVGRFSDEFTGREQLLSPPLLDAASQLLSAFSLQRGQTFILKSIERLSILAPHGPGPWWAQAFRTEGGEDGQPMGGSVQVVDAEGSRLWEVSGVTLAFIDRPTPNMTSSVAETRLCVASTFTAEPLEESLKFWGEYFQRKVRIDFAPYNQVFQQLLDPASAFRSNRDGINLVVLDLEDWLHKERGAMASPDPARAAVSFGNRLRTILPNGLEIVHLNPYETDYVYREIFEDESYLRHGIQLADGNTVIDIGANIGLFSLFVLSRCRNPALYCYEPSPRVFDLLQANCAAYGDPARVRAFNCGVAASKGQARFTFYEHSSVFSSFHPDERDDRAAVQAIVRNVLQNELSEDGVREADVEDLTAHRLRAETIDCRLTSVSEIIRENGLTRIHLLKIDAEKSELEILRGIEEEHWPLIEQIVMEVHDRTRAAVEQVEEQLSRRGFQCAVVEETLLENSGLFNIYATRTVSSGRGHGAEERLRRRVEEFSAALETFVASSAAPLILAVSPRAAGPSNELLQRAELSVLARAARFPQVRAIGSSSILARYPVREWHDRHSHQLGHMPFTPEGYAALGTALSRGVFQLKTTPIKVIALDCDNTLWQGQCGEDGPAGVRITEPFRRLQEFMIAQQKAGVLLVLCSKNNEADALAVLERHADMPLRREHLAAWQINWKTKPENLRALAAQLNLGLESFVFIDDNPLECATVRSACPEVLVLQLPADSERIPTFLENVWIFDRAAATREDGERSRWYQANAAREGERAAAPTLRDFLDGLELHVDIAEATDEQMGRVAQLTTRTNQFNLTSVRRSEEQIRALLSSGARCLVTSVRDRFGDYGLVGAILYTVAADRYVIDTLLLSCRALGKGVEHRMLADLAGRALRDDKAVIEISYRQTERNEPAREFIERLSGAAPGGQIRLELAAATLADLRYEPREEGVGRASAVANNKSTGGKSGPNLSATMQKLGDELGSVGAIVSAIASARPPAGPAAPEVLENGSTLERSLCNIWKKALGRTHIGLHENFFDAGGTSLTAVVVITMIRRELKRSLSIVALFESPTIKLLAAKLDDNSSAVGSAAAAASAQSRGLLRRQKLATRRAASR